MLKTKLSKKLRHVWYHLLFWPCMIVTGEQRCLVMHQHMGQVELVVLQQQDDELWKPVTYFSRALANVEAHYSPIGKECLGFTWVCEHASDYILGKPIIGETDHKPLLPMLTTHHLDQLPSRIQRFLRMLMILMQKQKCLSAQFWMQFQHPMLNCNR